MKQLKWIVGLLLLSAFAHAEMEVNVYPANRYNDQRVEVYFYIIASTTTVFNVLSDYNNLPKFVSSLTMSRVVVARHECPDPATGGVMHCLSVEQEGLGHAFLFKKRVHVKLDVSEYYGAGQTIYFEDVSHKDFDNYVGYWFICPRENGTHSLVSYTLISKPKFKVPFSVHVAKKNVTKMMEEVQAEMLRRQK
jgi:hypothetical protein